MKHNTKFWTYHTPTTMMQKFLVKGYWKVISGKKTWKTDIGQTIDEIKN